MNPRREAERLLVAQLEAQLSALLELRARLDRERSDFEQAGMTAEATATGTKITFINTEKLPALQKRIRDAANATKDSRAKKDLNRLLKRAVGATSGIYTERTVDISPAREAELQRLLAAAKTTPERIRLTGELEQLRRDCALIEKERDESAKQDEERRREHREKKDRKKTDRLFRKLDRNKPQEGA